MYDMLRWRQYAECVQFCWVTLVAQILHKKPCFKPVVAFWICDVCECHFRMRVNGDACCCFTSIIANVDIVLLKWLYGHPSTCQMRSHTTEKTQTVVFCLRHVKLSFSSSLCFFFSIRRSSSASRRDLEVSFRAVFAEAGGAQRQTS